MSRFTKWIKEYWLPLILLFIMAIILMFSAYTSSPTADEPAHIPAGYGYINPGDYRFNIEHPPLVKYLSAIPLVLDRADVFPMETYLNQKENFWGFQWQMGIDYLYQAGNSPTRILFLARLPIILLSLLLGWLVFETANYYWGKKVGLFALVLYVFNPNILAHSNLVTTDLGAAFGTFVAIAAISIYLKEWKRKFFIYSILAVAFAFLAKFSAIVVLPILFLLPLTNYLLESKKSDSLKTGRKLFQDYLRLATIFLFAFLIVYCFYLLLLLRTPNQIYVQNIKEVFPGNRYNLQTIFSQAHILFRPIIYYIAGFLYATGHTIGGHLSFFLGNLSMTGNVLYFPIIFVLKNQIVFLPLFLFGLVLAIREKKGELLLLGLMAFFFLYMIVSMKSSLNIGIRHLLPIFPAAIIFSALALEKTSKYFKGLITYIVLVLYILPVLLTFPHYISYANKIVPQDQKYKYFGDSSLDWGQGLKDLKSYAEKNNLETLRVDYFGGGAPVNYYLPKATVWHYKDGIPEDGYIAISVTTLQFVGYYPEGKGYFEYFYNKKPYAEVSGGSILIYKIK